MLAWLCLGQGADLHMAQLVPLPFTISCSSKSRLVLPFWCQLTQVVPVKIQEGCKMVVCVLLQMTWLKIGSENLVSKLQFTKRDTNS